MNGGVEAIRVLHVDDEAAFRERVATVLADERDGFAVRSAPDAESGLDVLASGGVDCVVSGYDLPGRNGVEFLEAVRERHPDLPFVLLAGAGSEAVAADAISAGVTDYFRKDAGDDQFDELADSIENALVEHRASSDPTSGDSRLRELSEASDDILWMYTADWSELLFINSAYDDIWGRPREALTERPEDFMEGIHPDDRDTAKRATASLSDGVPQDIEIRVNEREDYGRWVWIKAEPIFDDSGEVVRVAGFARDVTDRKRQAERFRAYVERSMDMFTVLQPDGRIEYQSPSIEHILGWGQDELVDENAFERVHPDDRERVTTAFSRLVSEPDANPTVEYRFETADGDWRWMESRGNNQLENPAVDGIVVNSRDITDRKAFERELERARDRMEFALETTDAIVWDWNVDADEATFYPSAESLYGTDVETLEDFVEVVHPDDRDDVREALEHSLATGEPKYEAIRAVRDGEVRWIEAPGRPIEADDGTTRMVGVAKDITEMKRREAELEQQNERLDEFAGIVSHDLRNPLNVAHGHLELLADDCDSEHIDVIEQAISRTRDLLENLLTLAREGSRVEAMEPVELGETVRLSWQTVQTAEATLDVAVESTIEADRNRLAQLLENLFRNAVEHGGADVAITVGALEDVPGFYVADDGPGIPEAERDRVFETGYSSGSDGTGFGLSIVEGIATAHGWDISVDSGEDGGARFEISGVDVRP